MKAILINITILIALIILGLAINNEPTQPIGTTPILPVEAERDVSATEVFILTNQEREKYGLWHLVRSSELEASAKEKACDMDQRNYFDHVDPDGNEPWILFHKYGYNFYEAGENLAEFYWSSAQIVQAWMASPGHRENILSPRYYEMGIATCGLYTVQHFGAR